MLPCILTASQIPTAPVTGEQTAPCVAQPQPHRRLWLSTLTVSSSPWLPTVGLFTPTEVLDMLTVLSINSSPTFQLSEEHVLLNIDRGDK